MRARELSPTFLPADFLSGDSLSLTCGPELVRSYSENDLSVWANDRGANNRARPNNAVHNPNNL